MTTVQVAPAAKLVPQVPPVPGYPYPLYLKGAVIDVVGAIPYAGIAPALVMVKVLSAVELTFTFPYPYVGPSEIDREAPPLVPVKVMLVV